MYLYSSYGCSWAPAGKLVVLSQPFLCWVGRITFFSFFLSSNPRGRTLPRNFTMELCLCSSVVGKSLHVAAWDVYTGVVHRVYSCECGSADDLSNGGACLCLLGHDHLLCSLPSLPLIYVWSSYKVRIYIPESRIVTLYNLQAKCFDTVVRRLYRSVSIVKSLYKLKTWAQSSSIILSCCIWSFLHYYITSGTSAVEDSLPWSSVSIGWISWWGLLCSSHQRKDTRLGGMLVIIIIDYSCTVICSVSFNILIQYGVSLILWRHTIFYL